MRWRRRLISTHRGNAIHASEHGTSKGDAAVDCDRDPDSIIAGAGSKENCDALHVFVGANPASGDSLRHLLRLIPSSSIHFRRKRARSYRVDADIRLDQLGYEWDGIVAWSFAATIPARLDKLVILNAPHSEALLPYALRDSAHPGP